MAKQKNQQDRRDARRVAAADRKAISDSRSIKDRIANAKQAPGEAKRELARLAKLDREV